jgi:hypothetical protein
MICGVDRAGMLLINYHTSDVITLRPKARPSIDGRPNRLGLNDAQREYDNLNHGSGHILPYQSGAVMHEYLPRKIVVADDVKTNATSRKRRRKVTCDDVQVFTFVGLISHR